MATRSRDTSERVRTYLRGCVRAAGDHRSPRSSDQPAPIGHIGAGRAPAEPVRARKQVATLQQLTEGRLVLGIGAGWSKPEFTTVGADYTTRGAVTDDTLAVLAHLLSGGSAPYAARRFGYDQGVFAPVPDRPVPVMIGGNSPAALRRAARFGDIWQGIPASIDEFKKQVRTLRGLSSGRLVTPAMRLPWPEGASADQIGGQVEAYHDAGAEHVAVHLGSHDGASHAQAGLPANLQVSLDLFLDGIEAWTSSPS